MRKNIYCTFLMFAAFILQACTSNYDFQGLMFMDVEINNSPDNFIQELTGTGRFRVVSNGDAVAELFTNDYYGYSAKVEVSKMNDPVIYVRVYFQSPAIVETFADISSIFNRKYGESKGMSRTSGGMMTDRWETESGNVYLSYCPNMLNPQAVGDFCVEYESCGSENITYTKTTTY